MNKNIFIAGGSGLIGSYLINKLESLNCNVTILSRTPGENTIVYPEKEEDLAKIIDGAAAVINFAGASIVGKRWNPEYKKILYDSRIKTTRYLVNAINLTQNKPYFISNSAVGFYGDRGNKILNEDTNPDSGFIANLCIDWEEEAHKANTKTFIPRIGIVLSTEGGALKEMLTPFKLFVGGPLADGKQWFPWIHIDDLASLLIFALENQIEGTANAVSPNPVQMNEFAQTLAKVLKRPAIFRVPAFALKIILGESAQEVLRSQRVNPQFMLNTNFEYKYQLLDSALNNLINNK